MKTKSKLTPKYSITIKWGCQDDGDVDEPPKTYNFKTRAEYLAFEDGVEEAIGWLEHDVVKRIDPDTPEEN